MCTFHNSNFVMKPISLILERKERKDVNVFTLTCNVCAPTPSHDHMGMGVEVA